MFKGIGDRARDGSGTRTQRAMNPVAVAVDKILEATVGASFSRVGYATRSRARGLDRSTLAGRTSRADHRGDLGHRLRGGGAFGVTGRDAHPRRPRRREGPRQPRQHSARGVATSASTTWWATSATSWPCDASPRAVGERGPLDVVIHNAGALAATRTLSPQGFEMTTAVQLLGPFLLTQLLLPALTHDLARSRPHRVVGRHVHPALRPGVPRDRPHRVTTASRRTPQSNGLNSSSTTSGPTTWPAPPSSFTRCTRAGPTRRVSRRRCLVSTAWRGPCLRIARPRCRHPGVAGRRS